MAGEEEKSVNQWGRNVLVSHLNTVLVFLALLTSPSAADIFVFDNDSNDTRPLTLLYDMPSNFGPIFHQRGLAGRIVYSTPPEACSHIQPPPAWIEDNNRGWILVAARGGQCSFADKVLAAQQKGYDAVIIHNLKGEESLIRMSANESGSFVNIPSTFVGWQNGMRLKHEYNYTSGRYYVEIKEQGFTNNLYLWPFAIVVAICFLLVGVFVIAKSLRACAAHRVNRLSKKHLKKIPVRKYKEGDYYDTCAICLDEYKPGEKVRVLPCDHVYHRKCIDPWLTENKKTCPMCKRRVISGSDADDSGSENNVNINSSERTPLLTDSSSSDIVPAPQYTTPVTLRLHSPVCLAPARRERPGVESADLTVPTHSGGAQGAVGGAGISDGFIAFSVEVDISAQISQGRGIHSRRSEWRRPGLPREGEPAETLIVHGRVDEPVAETREERRERRQRRRERKLDRRRAQQEAAMRRSRPRDEEMSHDVLVEVAEDSSTESAAIVSVEVLPSGAGSTQETESGNGEADDRHENYINPSYSESQELVLRNPGDRHEMNDMV